MTWFCNHCIATFKLKASLDFHLSVVHYIENISEKKFHVFSKPELGLEAMNLLKGFEYESCPRARNMIHGIVQEMNESDGKRRQHRKK